MKILKTASYKKIAQKLNRDRKELALRLLEWHGGQNSPLYSVGSTWLAGKEVPVENINEAIGELEDILQKKVNYPDTITENDIVEVKKLQNDLRQEIDRGDNLLNPEADKTNMEFVRKNIDTNFKNRTIDPNKI